MSTTGKKCIHNPLTQEQKYVNQEDLEKYLFEGWVKGISTKARENLSKGISKARQELFADPVRGAAVRENQSKGQKELYADPVRGAAARENHSKAAQELFADPVKGAVARENISKAASKAQKELYADPERGAKARENISKGQKELHADPEKGAKARENMSKGASKGLKKLYADPVRAEAVKSKRHDTMKENGTFNTSEPEEILYNILMKQNPGKTVIRQYREERYPFNCDFYIPEDDLFIELNGTWTHGGHPYNPEDPRDQRKLEIWKERSQTSKYYVNAIRTWTDLDVRKQKAAKENNLNYRVIYKNEYNEIVKQYA